MDLSEVNDFLTRFNMINFIQGTLKLIIIFVLTLVLLKISNYFIARWRKYLQEKRTLNHISGSELEKERRLDTLTGLSSKGIRITIIIVAILVSLQTIGVSIGPILASAGVVGLAIGFGAQNLVQDVISGFFILLENQVRTGDVAVINGTGGLVEQINFRTITLRDLSGVVHYFRNGSINTLANMTMGWSAIVFDIRVAYKENLDKVMKTMTETFQRLKEDPEFGNDILEDMEIFGLDQFGDSALIIKARIKTHPLHQWRIGRAYRKLLKEAFDDQNIEIPFPHRSIYFGEASRPFEFKDNFPKDSAKDSKVTQDHPAESST